MRDKDIHVGDVLQIRQWSDMINEFGLSLNGSIACRAGFVDKMSYMCGQKFTVAALLKPYGDIITYQSMERIEYDLEEEDDWDITSDMLEPFTEEECYVANDEDIKRLLT